MAAPRIAATKPADGRSSAQSILCYGRRPIAITYASIGWNRTWKTTLTQGYLQSLPTLAEVQHLCILPAVKHFLGYDSNFKLTCSTKTKGNASESVFLTGTLTISTIRSSERRQTATLRPPEFLLNKTESCHVETHPYERRSWWRCFFRLPCTAVHTFALTECELLSPRTHSPPSAYGRQLLAFQPSIRVTSPFFWGIPKLLRACAL